MPGQRRCLLFPTAGTIGPVEHTVSQDSEEALHKPGFSLELTSCALVVVSTRFAVRAEAILLSAFSLFPRALPIFALPAKAVVHAVSKPE